MAEHPTASSIPGLQEHTTAEGAVLALTGSWTLRGLRAQLRQLEPRLAAHAAHSGLTWDLRRVDALDNAGAVILWRAWEKHRPANLLLRPEHRHLFTLLENLPAREAPAGRHDWRMPFATLGHKLLDLWQLLSGLNLLLGQLVLDCLYLLRHPAHFPWRAVSANAYRFGPEALPILALVGFLVGVVFTYLSTQQLHNYGADVLIINTLGISVLREFGPVLTAVLVAGRSGSAITAQIGAMRVAQELDAMTVIGIPQGVRLILPKVAALTLVLPLTVLWTDGVALAGGALAADVQLNVDVAYFFSRLPAEVPVFNLWLGLVKGAVFGFVMALISCYFGLRIQPDTESMRVETTRSVVTSIAAVMVIDAIFAVLFFDVGIK